MTILKLNKNTLCSDHRKDCNIVASKVPSLASMHVVICKEHTSVISYEEKEEEDE